MGLEGISESELKEEIRSVLEEIGIQIDKMQLYEPQDLVIEGRETSGKKDDLRRQNILEVYRKGIERMETCLKVNELCQFYLKYFPSGENVEMARRAIELSKPEIDKIKGGILDAIKVAVYSGAAKFRVG